MCEQPEYFVCTQTRKPVCEQGWEEGEGESMFPREDGTVREVLSQLSHLLLGNIEFQSHLGL